MYEKADQRESVLGNRCWWDRNAADYQNEHRLDLGDAEFTWGPEGLREADAQLLGDVRGAVVLEVGAGAGQCSAWLASRGAYAIALDLSRAQLEHRPPRERLARLCAHAGRVPLADNSCDAAFSSYGAPQFVADLPELFAEVHRVLKPGAPWVFSVTHPIRWSFPDDPGPAGLTATRSYFDETPYVEHENGRVSYAEHHRTLGHYVADLTSAGFILTGLTEPTWPETGRRTWGGWSELRGRIIPGTMIFATTRSA